RARAVQQPRKDVAAIRIRAEQQQRLTLVRRGEQVAPEPFHANLATAHFLEAALEAADEVHRIEVDAVFPADVDPGWRREEVAVELTIRWVRREPWRRDCGQHNREEQRAAGRFHAACPSRTRGSAAKSSRSETRLPK